MPIDIVEQARRYIDKIDGAISGSNGHDQTFHVASILVEGFALSDADAIALMTEYSQRCQPPWSEREIAHKVASAAARVDPAKLGRMVRKGVRYAARSKVLEVLQQHVAPKPKAPTVRYEVSDALELPEAIKDGCRQFLASVFAEGEGIRIAVARTGDDSRELPKDSGLVLSREEWLRKLDQHDGNPNGFLKTSDKNGIFVSVNPMKIGGSKDSDVTAWRHALLEFDNISQVEQWGIIQASRIPCAAVISSGGKSVHAWVKVNASSRPEFDERVKMLYQHFSEYQPDEKNKNPSRFSRLPNCERGKSRQELLSLSCGCESFTEWLAESRTDGLGLPITAIDLEKFKPESDENNLLGNRWLGRGMACLIVGPSGVGKSSLNVQLAACWAMNRDAFGIQPARALKSMVIQAENDLGDLAEMYNGVVSGLKVEADSAEQDMLRRNLVFIRDNSHTGEALCENIRRLLDRHKPDLLWLDPILSFVGADLSRQEVVGQFFRNWLNPILDAAGVACFCIHHTGKPPSDKNARQGWQQSDYAYAGLGSSDLTNWARAVMVLTDRGHGLFELKLAKRGRRTGLPDTSIWMRHASEPGAIYWEQTERPEEAKSTNRKGGKPSDVDRIAHSNLHSFLIECVTDGEGLNNIAKRLESWLAKQSDDVSLKTCKRIIPALVKNNKLSKGADALYRKGANA